MLQHMRQREYLRRLVGVLHVVKQEASVTSLGVKRTTTTRKCLGCEHTWTIIDQWPQQYTDMVVDVLLHRDDCPTFDFMLGMNGIQPLDLTA